MTVKLNDLFAIYNQIVWPQGLKNVAIGYENAIKVLDYVKYLVEILKEVDTFIRENSETINGKNEIKEDKRDEFKILMNKEIEQIKSLDLNKKDPSFVANVKLQNIEGLILLWLL